MGRSLVLAGETLHINPVDPSLGRDDWFAVRYVETVIRNEDNALHTLLDFLRARGFASVAQQEPTQRFTPYWTVRAYLPYEEATTMAWEVVGDTLRVNLARHSVQVLYTVPSGAWHAVRHVECVVHNVENRMHEVLVWMRERGLAATAEPSFSHHASRNFTVDTHSDEIKLQDLLGLLRSRGLTPVVRQKQQIWIVRAETSQQPISPKLEAQSEHIHGDKLYTSFLRGRGSLCTALNGLHEDEWRAVHRVEAIVRNHENTLHDLLIYLRKRGFSVITEQSKAQRMTTHWIVKALRCC